MVRLFGFAVALAGVIKVFYFSGEFEALALVIVGCALMLQAAITNGR